MEVVEPGQHLSVEVERPLREARQRGVGEVDGLNPGVVVPRPVAAPDGPLAIDDFLVVSDPRGPKRDGRDPLETGAGGDAQPEARTDRHGRQTPQTAYGSPNRSPVTHSSTFSTAWAPPASRKACRVEPAHGR